jgi:hypothetical protein
MHHLANYYSFIVTEFANLHLIGFGNGKFKHE